MAKITILSPEPSSKTFYVFRRLVCNMKRNNEFILQPVEKLCAYNDLVYPSGYWAEIPAGGKFLIPDILRYEISGGEYTESIVMGSDSRKYRKIKIKEATP